MTQRLPKEQIFFNTVAFALCFAMWVMLGPSSATIAEDLDIPLATAKRLKAAPILLGSIVRVPVGILADRLGARFVFPAVILVSALGTLGLSFSQDATELAISALLMGLVGTSFAVGVQSVSSWTPPDKRGFALGIFGAGNVGTAMTTFGMPFLLAEFGWRSTFRIYAFALIAVAVLYFALMRNAPRQGAAPTFRALLAPLKDTRAWRFGVYYMATFGVFVATTLLVTDIYVDGFGLSLTNAGIIATTFTFTASLARIPGGKWADTHGARRVLMVSLLTIATCLLPVSMRLPLFVTATLIFIAAIAMGAGMAATYRYIPDFYPSEVGAVGGIVGALGGLGGFILPRYFCAPTEALFGFSQAQVLPIAGFAAAALVVQLFAARDEGQTLPATDASGTALNV